MVWEHLLQSSVHPLCMLIMVYGTIQAKRCTHFCKTICSQRGDQWLRGHGTCFARELSSCIMQGDTCERKQAKTGDTPLDWCLPHYKKINLCERVWRCTCIERYCMYQIRRYCHLSQWMPCKLGSGEMLQYRYKSLSHLVTSHSIVVMPDQG